MNPTSSIFNSNPFAGIASVVNHAFKEVPLHVQIEERAAQNPDASDANRELQQWMLAAPNSRA